MNDDGMLEMLVFVWLCIAAFFGLYAGYGLVAWLVGSETTSRAGNCPTPTV